MTEIAEIFQIDPEGLTEEKIVELIKYFREKRGLFNAGNLKAGSTKTIKNETAAKVANELDLDDLLKS